MPASTIIQAVTFRQFKGMRSPGSPKPDGLWLCTWQVVPDGAGGTNSQTVQIARQAAADKIMALTNAVVARTSGAVAEAFSINAIPVITSDDGTPTTRADVVTAGTMTAGAGSNASGVYSPNSPLWLTDGTVVGGIAPGATVFTIGIATCDNLNATGHAFTWQGYWWDATRLGITGLTPELP